jgi:hypothetical protein
VSLNPNGRLLGANQPEGLARRPASSRIVCIGERRKRYDAADELIEALRHPPALPKAGRLASLKGVHFAFTGILSRPRREPKPAARRPARLTRKTQRRRARGARAKSAQGRREVEVGHPPHEAVGVGLPVGGHEQASLLPHAAR